MKNLKSIIAILTITLVTSFAVNATEIEPSTKNSKLRAEVVKHLGTKLPFQLEKNSEAEVSFILNNKNEIVVVTVDTKVPEFYSFVKNKLNYKKIKTTGLTKGEIYKMPVKLNTVK